MNKNTEISERISQVIDYLDTNPNDFAKKLGYGRSQAIYDIINAKAKPSFDFFSKLYNSEYSELISPEWLFTGKGEMLKTSSLSVKDGPEVKEPKKEIEPNCTVDAEERKEYLLIIKSQQDTIKQMQENSTNQLKLIDKLTSSSLNTALGGKLEDVAPPGQGMIR